MKHFLLSAQIENHILSLKCSFVIHFCTERKVSIPMYSHTQLSGGCGLTKYLNTEVTLKKSDCIKENIILNEFE